MKKTKRQNGITLVALVITIIILLILATISIQSLTNTGLVKKVEDNIGRVLSTTDNTELQDAYGNKIVVPAGFKIVSNSDTNNATTVDKGIVIEDVTLGATAGSQFVWIPVGKIYTDIAKTDANAKTIELGRYEFDSNGNKSAYSGSYVEEDKGDTNTTLKNYGNTIAKNITNFKNSVAANGGQQLQEQQQMTH